MSSFFVCFPAFKTKLSPFRAQNKMNSHRRLFPLASKQSKKTHLFGYKKKPHNAFECSYRPIGGRKQTLFFSVCSTSILILQSGLFRNLSLVGCPSHSYQLLWFLFKSRENLSPFTKDFRGEEQINEYILYFSCPTQQGNNQNEHLFSLLSFFV